MAASCNCKQQTDCILYMLGHADQTTKKVAEVLQTLAAEQLSAGFGQHAQVGTANQHHVASQMREAAFVSTANSPILVASTGGHGIDILPTVIAFSC